MSQHNTLRGLQPRFEAFAARVLRKDYVSSAPAGFIVDLVDCFHGYQQDTAIHGDTALLSFGHVGWHTMIKVVKKKRLEGIAGNPNPRLALPENVSYVIFTDLEDLAIHDKKAKKAHSVKAAELHEAQGALACLAGIEGPYARRLDSKEEIAEELGGLHATLRNADPHNIDLELIYAKLVLCMWLLKRDERKGNEVFMDVLHNDTALTGVGMGGMLLNLLEIVAMPTNGRPRAMPASHRLLPYGDRALLEIKTIGLYMDAASRQKLLSMVASDWRSMPTVTELAAMVTSQVGPAIKVAADNGERTASVAGLFTMPGMAKKLVMKRQFIDMMSPEPGQLDLFSARSRTAP